MRLTFTINLLLAALLMAYPAMGKGRTTKGSHGQSGNHSARLLDDALAARLSGNMNRSTALLKECIGKDSTNHKAHLELANNYIIANRWEQASAELNRYVELCPNADKKLLSQLNR